MDNQLFQEDAKRSAVYTSGRYLAIGCLLLRKMLGDRLFTPQEDARRSAVYSLRKMLGDRLFTLQEDARRSAVYSLGRCKVIGVYSSGRCLAIACLLFR